jgi:3-hydroxyisobutyryl-CoA hydrolase
VPRVVLISGAGGKAFCAGGDVVAIYNATKGLLANDSPRRRQFGDQYLLFYSLSQMQPFQISLLNGITLGGGVGLTWHSPVRIATEGTVIAMPEA